MNPLRAFFLSLSGMPPAVMLLIIIGFAVLVTMMVTGKVSEQEAQMEAAGASSRYVVMSSNAIPANTEIDKTMIVQRRAAGNEIWSDAITSRSNVIGRVTEKEIPAHTQIREADLQ